MMIPRNVSRKTTTKPTIRETLPPYIIRARTSNPSPSVPRTSRTFLRISSRHLASNRFHHLFIRRQQKTPAQNNRAGVFNSILFIQQPFPRLFSHGTPSLDIGQTAHDSKARKRLSSAWDHKQEPPPVQVHSTLL